MLEPIADIVITVFPQLNKILVDYAIPNNTKTMEDIFNALGGRRFGIECHQRNNGWVIFFTRVWDGHDIALEIKRLIEEKQADGKWCSIQCQIEGENVSRRLIQ
jgi:hypothetical protein